MSLTGPELELMAQELAALVGGHVQKVTVASPQVAAVELRVPGRSAVVLFDASPTVARVCVVPRRPPAPARPFALQGLLRAQVGGARLEAVEADAGRRLLLLVFAAGPQTRRLVFEISSGAGGLVLLDAHDKVLGGALEHLKERGVSTGKPWTPPPPPGGEAPAARFTPIAGADWPLSEAISRHYEVVSSRRSDDTLRRRLTSSVRKQLQRARRTLGKVRADRARIDEASTHRERGDLLKPALTKLSRGATEAVVTQWLAEGPVEVRVPLLPHLSPRENMERYYHLHRRLSRGAALVDERLRMLEQEEARLASLLSQIEASSDEQLESVAEQLPDSVPSTPRRGADQPAARLPYRQYLSASGQRLWVGRGARDNDALTFRHARGNDLWLHARGVPGSHVLVPGCGPRGPDGETLLDAAMLAAHFSGARGEQVAEVAATQRKYVSKPKGAAAGAVRFSQERTVALRLEPARLERLLATEGQSSK